LYDNPPGGPALYPNTADNLKSRKAYLPTENANAYRLRELYGAGNMGTFPTDTLFVLCDMYNRVKDHDTGKQIGMPILYYRANTSNTIYDPNGTLPSAWNVDNGYIYNHWDNDTLVGLAPNASSNPLYSGYTGPPAGTDFYRITRDPRISISTGWPYMPTSYILISAGYDGIFGTDDDVFNFVK
jgi:hypothetical protein